MKKKVVAGSLVFVAVVILAIVIAKTGKNKENPLPAQIAQPVYASAEGKVEAIPGYEIEVGSELDGKIAEIRFEEGDTVRKGDIIAELDNSDIRAKLSEAERGIASATSKLKEIESGSRPEEIKAADAELQSAKAVDDYEQASLLRFRELFKQGIIARDQLDEKEKAARSSAANVRKAAENKTLLEKGPKAETIQFYKDEVSRANATAEYYSKVLEKSFIRSPISGKLLRKYVHVGELVSKDVQAYIVAVADTEKIRINAEVDENDIGKIKVGDPVSVTSYAFAGQIFKGTVQEISDYAGIRQVKPNSPIKNIDMKVVQVKIALRDKTPLKIGMTVDVKITAGDLNRNKQ